jgi:phosphoserine phosphatase RsbU/P
MITATCPTCRLEVLTGPTRGQRLVLDQPSVLIGRHASCDLVLDDPAVSRRHARIERRADGYYLYDLQSLNGTTVNGRRIREPRALGNGDLIHVHCFVLTFAEGDAGSDVLPAPDEGADSAEPDEDWLPGRILASVDAASGSFDDELSPTAVARHMVRYLGASTSVDESLQRCLEGLFSLFPQADRGSVMLVASDGQLALRALKTRCEEAFNSLTAGPTPRAVAARVMDEERALLVCDRTAHEDVDHVIDACPRWAMYAPLLGPGGAVAGIVQLDTQDRDRPFTEEDLRKMLLSVLIAGLAFESAAATASQAGAPRDVAPAKD